MGAVVGVLVGFGWGLGGGKEMLQMEGGRKGSVHGGCEWRRVDAAMEVVERKLGVLLRFLLLRCIDIVAQKRHKLICKFCFVLGVKNSLF